MDRWLSESSALAGVTSPILAELQFPGSYLSADQCTLKMMCLSDRFSFLDSKSGNNVI